MVLTLSRDDNPDLYLTENDGRIIRRLTHGEGVNVSPSFSPDGRRLAFVSDRSGTDNLWAVQGGRSEFNKPQPRDVANADNGAGPQ